MEFEPVNTQEEFEARVTAQYGDVADLQGRLETVTGERDTHANTIAELRNEIKGYKTTALKEQIAREKGIPYEMASRLTGETEDDIRKDADVIATMIRGIKGPAPLFQPENHHIDTGTVGLTSVLNELRGE